MTGTLQHETYQAERLVTEFVNDMKTFVTVYHRLNGRVSEITNRGGSAATAPYWGDANGTLVEARNWQRAIFDNAVGSWSAVQSFIQTNNHEDNFFGLK